MGGGRCQHTSAGKNTFSEKYKVSCCRSSDVTGLITIIIGLPFFNVLPFTICSMHSSPVYVCNDRLTTICLQKAIELELIFLSLNT